MEANNTSLKHIHTYLERNAKEFADKPAIIQDGTTLTWAELSAKVDACAAVLAKTLNTTESTTEQEVVSILLANSWQFMVVYLAVLKTGHIALPLDPNYKKLEIDGILEQITPKLHISDPVRAALFSEPVLLADDLVASPAVEAGARYYEMPAEQQVASLLFTSGTTGKPKITQYSHTNHMWNITAVSDLWKWTGDDTLLLSLPLSHWHALVMGVDGALYHGNTIYLQERFEAESTLEMLASGKISLFMHVPIAYSRLVLVPNPERYDISKVRLCVSGSSYLPPAIWQDFEAKFGQKILERYGASEMGLLTSNPLDDRQPGSVGMPLKDVTIKVTESGELAMKSPGLFLGYYKNPEATEKNYTKEGLWMTGDIGELAENGRLVLKGRVIEKLKKLGYTVYPRDVEWAVQKLSGIHEVVLIGIQDEKNLSDTLVYLIVGNRTEQEITDYCKANLPGAWRADKIILLDEIPKTRSGKPVRRELLALAEEALKTT